MSDVTSPRLTGRTAICLFVEINEGTDMQNIFTSTRKTSNTDVLVVYLVVPGSLWSRLLSLGLLCLIALLPGQCESLFLSAVHFGVILVFLVSLLLFYVYFLSF